MATIFRMFIILCLVPPFGFGESLRASEDSYILNPPSIFSKPPFETDPAIVFEALLALSKNPSDPRISRNIRGFLSKSDPAIVAESVFEYLNFLDTVFFESRKRIDAKEQKEAPLPDSVGRFMVAGVTIHYPPSFPITEGLASKINDLFGEEDLSTDREALGQLLKQVRRYQKAILEFLPDLRPEVLERFVIRCEEDRIGRRFNREYHSDNFIEELTVLLGRGNARWQEALYPLRENPLIGYGSFYFWIMGRYPERSYEIIDRDKLTLENLIDRVGEKLARGENSLQLYSDFQALDTLICRWEGRGSLAVIWMNWAAAWWN